MRTTVDIPEELLRIARERAAREGESLSQIVQRALRAHLEAAGRSRAGKFELIVGGKPGGRAPSAPEIHRLLDEQEWRPPR